MLPFIFLLFGWNIFLFGRLVPIPSSTCFFSWKAALQTQSHRPALFNALHNWCSLLLLLLILLVFWWCFCLLCFCSGCCCVHMRKDMANLQYVMCLILVPSRAVQGCWSGISDHSQTDTVALQPHPLSLSLSVTAVMWSDFTSLNSNGSLSWKNEWLCVWCFLSCSMWFIIRTGWAEMQVKNRSHLQTVHKVEHYSWQSWQNKQFIGNALYLSPSFLSLLHSLLLVCSFTPFYSFVLLRLFVSSLLLSFSFHYLILFHVLLSFLIVHSFLFVLLTFFIALCFTNIFYCFFVRSPSLNHFCRPCISYYTLLFKSLGSVCFFSFLKKIIFYLARMH